MIILKRPSRPDAKRATSTERKDIIFLLNALIALDDARNDMGRRLEMVDGGKECIDNIVKTGMKLLDDIMVTLPEDQRKHMINTWVDYKMRLVPNMMPQNNNVILHKEEVRTLVDAAQVKCRECLEMSENKEKCPLFRILSITVPLDEYEGTFLCPYNLSIGKWEN